eukprot:254839-Rhodomonas_salina.2
MICTHCPASVPNHWSSGWPANTWLWMPHSDRPMRLVPRLILKKPSMPHADVQLLAHSQYLRSTALRRATQPWQARER